MESDLLSRTIEAAVAETEAIDVELARLQARRRSLVDYVRASRVMLGLDENPGPGSQGDASGPRMRHGGSSTGTGLPPPPLPRGGETHLSPQEATSMRSERRRYLQRLVDQSVAVLADAGRPMTIDELHAVHPERDAVSRDLLYHTVYKRHAQGRQVIMDRGLFWILGEDLPEGWRHPMPPGVSHAKRPARKR